MAAQLLDADANGSVMHGTARTQAGKLGHLGVSGIKLRLGLAVQGLVLLGLGCLKTVEFSLGFGFGCQLGLGLLLEGLLFRQFCGLARVSGGGRLKGRRRNNIALEERNIEAGRVGDFAAGLADLEVCPFQLIEHGLAGR